MQIYFKNHSNNYQTWWSTQSYITYQFIIPFQFYMKSSIHVISQKINLNEDFHSNKCKCEYIKVFRKSTIVWKITRIVKEDLCQKSIFNVSQNTKRNEKKFAPKIIQNVLKTNTFSCPKCATIVCFHPNLE